MLHLDVRLVGAPTGSSKTRVATLPSRGCFVLESDDEGRRIICGNNGSVVHPRMDAVNQQGHKGFACRVFVADQSEGCE